MREVPRWTDGGIREKSRHRKERGIALRKTVRPLRLHPARQRRRRMVSRRPLASGESRKDGIVCSDEIQREAVGVPLRAPMLVTERAQMVVELMEDNERVVEVLAL